MMRHATTAMAIVLLAAAAQGALTDNFDPPVAGVTSTQGGSAPGPVVTAGGPSGQFLRLINDGVGNQLNRYSYDRTDAGAYSTITAQFDFAGYSADQGADGFSFAVLPTSLYGASGAGPVLSENASAAGVLGIGFWTYPGGTNHVSLHLNNQQLFRNAVDPAKVNFVNGVWNRAQWTVNALGPGSFQKLDLIGDVNGAPQTVTVFNQYVFGAGPFENRVQFSGRTGGANMSADFDNINIAYSNPTTAPGTISAPANTLIQDFDNYGTTPFALSPNTGSPGPSVLSGGPSGNYLRLIQQTNGLNNQIAFDRVATGQYQRIEAEWDMNVLSGADGAAFVLYNTGWNGTTGTVPAIGEWENPLAANAFGIGFDVYPSIYQVSLNWNNTQVAKIGPYDFRNAWHKAKAVIDYVSGGANVTLDLVDGSSVAHNIFSNYFVAGMVPYENRPVFGGRTGGVNTNFDLDNVQVKWLNAIAQPTDPFHWRGITGDYGTAANWTNNVLPTGNDNAVIDVGVATGNVNLQGTGGLTVTGTGGLNVGTLRVAGAAGARGSLVLAGNSQTVANTDFFVADGAGSVGSFTIGDNARLTVNGTYTVIGRDGVATAVQNGGTINAKTFFLAEFGGSAGTTYTLNNGSLNVTSADIARTAQATFTQTGGTFTDSGDLYVRDKQDGGGSLSDVGTYDMQGGTLTVTGTHTVIGRGGQGRFIQDGNSTVNVRRLFLAEFAGSDGSSYELKNGTLNASMRVEVARHAAATFTQTGGTFNAMGTLEASPDDFSLLIGRDVAGTYNLQGGTLNARTIRKRSDSQFNFTGGRLQADLVEFALTNAGGTLAPGHPVGTTTINGGYTQQSGTLEMELTSGGNDLLVVNGPLALGGTLSLLANYDIPENTRILLIDNDSDDSITGQFEGLGEKTWFGAPGVRASFQITYVGGTGNDVEVLTVPEPATMGLLALAASGLAGYIRRRRRA